MTAIPARRSRKVLALSLLLALPLAAWLASCDGDGVGLDRNGDLIVDNDPGSPQDSAATLLASKDNTLYESSLGNLSNGVGEYIFAGRTASGFIRRALMAFDVAGAIPPGATISSVTLTLEMSREAAASGAEDVTLHLVSEDWGEGTSDAAGEEGSGTIATPGDATWLHRSFDTVLWSTVGGSFSATVSATQTVDAVGSYTWSGPQMVADVQSWLDNPSSNSGWILRSNEGASTTAKRFNSRENTASPPTLAIEFTQ